MILVVVQQILVKYIYALGLTQEKFKIICNNRVGEVLGNFFYLIIYI